MQSATAHTPTSVWNLTVLGYWRLRLNGEPVEVGARQQRVLSALALLGVRPRHFIATLLWPDGSEKQAAGNLRASIFRISHELPGILAGKDPLQFDQHVDVDVHRLRRLIGDITDSREGAGSAATIELLRTADLLPGWYDDWVVREQELLQHERVDALEILARKFIARGDIGPALVAARSAAAIEPLRESVQVLLVQAHLASDDQASAVRVYRDFSARIRSELGVTPSPRLTALLRQELAGISRSNARGGRRSR